jgi:hypothetical protein
LEVALKQVSGMKMHAKVGLHNEALEMKCQHGKVGLHNEALAVFVLKQA